MLKYDGTFPKDIMRSLIVRALGLEGENYIVVQYPGFQLDGNCT